jgi:two-component system, chemotaxis family, protein-glutamate methylesterase/glutaminase
MNHQELHVLVVDDSAVVRQVIQTILATDPRIRVSVAADPMIAMTKMAKDRPDVVITDLEMPRMDGLAFLRHLMAHDPLPVVVCSGVAEKGARLALEALHDGAVEVITKPKVGVREFLHESAVLLLDSVWSAAKARLRRGAKASQPEPLAKHDRAMASSSRLAGTNLSCDLIAIGASTGGPEALSKFLVQMPADCPPIAIVQHMPQMFTRAFAERLNRECVITVKEARQGDTLERGRALIAPGSLHMSLFRERGMSFVQVLDGPLVSRHRPSVNVLFRSAARMFGRSAIGIIMTGMGDDGADGLTEMKNAGAKTIAQDEESCVVFGMPKEAIARACVDHVVPLEKIAALALNG